jgi:hypothetical protein
MPSRYSELPKFTEDQIEECWGLVDCRGQDDCWPWFGTMVRQSGLFKSYPAHRVACLLHYGECPSDKTVLHICNNPGCVNPRHLRLDTDAENAHDCPACGHRIRRNTGGLIPKSLAVTPILRERFLCSELGQATFKRWLENQRKE